jgi:hypothetical protein
MITRTMSPRDYLLLGIIALGVGVALMLSVQEPGYTDAYYYYNAAERLAQGDGLTDPYIWIYLNTPDELPAPSHTYWMPLTSLLSGLSMSLFGTSFTAAQLPSLVLLVALVVFTGWLGNTLGGSARYGWLGGLLVLSGGYYFPFWLTTDAFALYGLLGAAALVTMGYGVQYGDWRWFIATGVLSGLAHLARNDGVLLAVIALVLIWWPWRPATFSQHLQRGIASLAVVGAYILTMLPWFIRNITVTGEPLPGGGVGTIFLRGYHELFAYPVDWSLANFLDWGLANIIDSRIEALLINGATLVAVEGMVILLPLALWALWKHRQEPLVIAFGLYALTLHGVMTFIFAYPGFRGGLLHSSAALFPFWVVFGAIGLDMGIEKMARWRNWNPAQARTVFGAALLVLGVGIGVGFSRLQAATQDGGNLYQEIDANYLPEDAVLMVNSPPTWYYFTGHWGVPLPQTPLELLPEIVEQFCVTHLVLDLNIIENFDPLFNGTAAPPDFMTQIAHIDRGTEDIKDDVRIYRFTIGCSAER